MTCISPRERVLAALEFRSEHGAALRKLWEQYSHDFGAPQDFPDRRPDPQFLDQNGRYEEMRRDEWGVLWQNLIFGMPGHPTGRPLDDWASLERFEPPPVPPITGEEFHRERARALVPMERYGIHVLAGMIVDYQPRTIRYLLARGAGKAVFFHTLRQWLAKDLAELGIDAVLRSRPAGDGPQYGTAHPTFRSAEAGWC